MQQQYDIRGVLPVFQTPFHEDESVDFATLEREIQWLFGLGCHGVVLGMVSEVLRLGAEERKRVVETACAAAHGRGPVVVSSGGESTVVAIDYARHAERAGAGALMIPVIVQDASSYVGSPLPLSLQLRLIETFGPSRIAFKPESSPVGPVIDALRRAGGPDLAIYEGDGGAQVWANYKRGLTGSIPGSEMVPAVKALWSSLEAGDPSRAARIAPWMVALVGCGVGLDGYLAIEKHLLVRQGIFLNTQVRGPIAFALDDAQRAHVDQLFDRLMAEIDG